MKSLMVLFLLAAGFGSAQNATSTCDIPKNQRVVIDFERFDRGKSTVTLKLTNYTIWPIRVPVELEGTKVLNAERSKQKLEKLEVRYYLEEYDPGPVMQVGYPDGHKEPPDEPKHPPVPRIHRVDFLTEWTIAPKDSLQFEVPKQDLARNVSLYVYLRYSWESLGTEVLDGPVHLVYFRGIDLPAKVQKDIQ